MTKQMLKTGVSNFLKENKKGYFFLKCTNYTDKKTYWVINGKLYVFTGFNSAYDVANSKTTTAKLKNDAIYELTEIDPQHKIYNLS